MYLGIDVAALWVTLTQMFNEVRSFDWLMLGVEVLVLVLIAYEVGVNFFHARKAASRTASVFSMVSKGQTLQYSVPDRSAEEETIKKWGSDVLSWDNETYSQLAKLSPQATATYTYNSAKAGVRYNLVPNEAHNSFVHLLSRLENLRSIMEKPDVYF